MAWRGLILAGTLAFAASLAGRAAAADCARLASLSPAGARVTSAEVVPANSGAAQPLPSFCRVRGVAGGAIGFELWLPDQGWNGKFEMVGNGGYSSVIDQPAMARLLARGYAVAATDTGHQGDDPDFARGHPEAIDDWAYRAAHQTAVVGKALTAIRYGASPSHAYFAGCSTGGHQALSEAQRYPEDFDGIIAGAAGSDRTHLNAGFLWEFRANHRPGEASPILPAAKLAMVSRAALEACRSDNGGAGGGLAGDAWLDDPLSCRFDPATLSCPAGRDGADCLTRDQVAALKAIYAGPRNPRTGGRVAEGYPPGSEASGGPPSLPGWSLYWADPRDPSQPARASFWRLWAGFGDGWDPWRFDFDRDMAAADARLAASVNATDPDLDTFRKRGGKLIAYHGLADPVVPVAYSIGYHRAVEARLAAAIGAERAKAVVGGFYRLFLAPGMAHCGGGAGITGLDAQTALEAWVERGVAPDRLIGRHSVSPVEAPTFTRPLCPYPAKARYDGESDPSTAAAFRCVEAGEP